MIVISVPAEDDVAVWGALMTAGAVARRHEGAVLDAAVRDMTEIRRDFDFPVFDRSVVPGTMLGRYRTAASNVPVAVGGVPVQPGDVVIGDVDGVVVVARVRAEAVLAAAQEIDLREAEQARLILAAKSLRENLAKYGRI